MTSRAKAKRENKSFIQKALSKGKRGATHRQLGISPTTKIPDSLLTRVNNAKVGSVVTNPTKTGRKRIKVTGTLKKRTVLASTLRGLPKKKK